MLGTQTERENKSTEATTAAGEGSTAITKDPRHLFAEKAVDALNRAWQSGDHPEFARAKRYWLRAGDPDLAGLRLYASYRAFEGGAYIVPSVRSGDIARHELYQHVRRILEYGAAAVEEMWTARSNLLRKRYTATTSVQEFEKWWQEERRAWLLVTRLGLFHRQWQTRWALIDIVREWRSSHDLPPLPFPYPEFSNLEVQPDIGDPNSSERGIKALQEMLLQLGNGSKGRPDWSHFDEASKSPYSTADTQQSSSTEDFVAVIHSQNRGWSEFAEQMVRDGRSRLDRGQLLEICIKRSALWGALRQCAEAESRAGRNDLQSAALGLPEPRTSMY